MVALVGVGNQLVDLAVGDLRQNAVAFADGQKDGIQHLVDALNQLPIRAVKDRRATSFGQPALLGCINKAHYFVEQRIAVVLRGNVLAIFPVAVFCTVQLAALVHQCG